VSDNPLADWLRERHEASAGGAQAREQEAADGPDRPVTWPDWALSPPTSPEEEPAAWARPPAGDAGRPPRRRLLRLAVVPWAVVGVVGAFGLLGVGEGPERPAAGTAAPAPARDDAPSVGASTPAPSVDPALGAAAAVAVRLAVTSAPASPAERRYVDVVIPASMHPVGDVTVVTVAAVVLEGSADRWHAARPARFAVPTRYVDGHPVAVGDPWPLPVPPPPGADAAWEPAPADRAGVARAVEAAGYTDVEVLEVHAHPELRGVLRAHVDALGPGEATPRSHRLWLHGETDPAVLGMQP